jgi:mono/diheme cytochrome c family protein
MKKPSVRLLLVLSAFVLLAATPRKASTPSSAVQQRVARGQYLVTVGGCNDCHSPKSGPATMTPDAQRLLAGRPAETPAPPKPATMGQIAVSGDLTAWYGPWGVSYTSNLTPDPETGIGKRYDEASFIRTMRTGKKPEGEAVLPPMPWPNYAKMTDEDLKSIYAYLRTLKPVRNFVRQATPPAGTR